MTPYTLQPQQMDVTESNYEQVVKIIDKLLPKVEFIAFDLEFTGLRYEKFERDHINLLPFEKYRKLKYVAETYQILQLGLSLIVFEDGLKVYPFNFYLFPRNPVFYDKTLSMQLGCVKFNSDNGMDWNKWIREGINYIQLAEMEEIERSDRNRTLKSLMDTLYSQNENIVHFFLLAVDKVARSPDKTTQCFRLTQPIYKHMSAIFYKYIEERNLDVSIGLMQGNKEDEDDLIIITKISKFEKNQISARKKSQICGFGLLFEKLWTLKKPYIGHNCLLDLMYLYHCFIANLPENYFEFKDNLRRSGNTFFDTKYIALKFQDIFGSETRLEDLLKNIQKRYAGKLSTVALEGEFKRYSLENPSLHEAGYDSYITAWVYLQMMKLRDDLDDCRNRININFSFFKVSLDRDEDEIDQYYAQNMLRINVEIIMDEDVKKKRMDMVKKMKDYLSEVGDLKAYQIHEGYREIFVEIKDKKREVLKCLNKMMGNVFRDIRTFSGYLEWQEERARKIAIAEISRDNRNDKPYVERKFVKNYRKESNGEKEKGKGGKEE